MINASQYKSIQEFDSTLETTSETMSEKEPFGIRCAMAIATINNNKKNENNSKNKNKNKNKNR